jgi:hypothetical protein
MPGVQNRADDYHQGTATDTFPGVCFSETTSGLTSPVCNSGAIGKGMPDSERKVAKTTLLNPIFSL